PPTRTPAPAPPSTTPSTTPPSATPRAPTEGREWTEDRQAAENRERRAADEVPAGGAVVVRVSGFDPGEQVTVTLHSTGERLATVTADDDGAVAAEVRIPAGTTPGVTTLDARGERSAAVAGVPLKVASAADEAAPRGEALVALLAAAALASTAVATLLAGGRQRSARR
ncbi:hypothetical protein, partial [Blastococcus sp. CCUG 61487]|uniref:hypothetical protein n=1 Tax=Blastococcus sp. CCUG 61487 TaxID=1840703 RepID=UPI001BAE6112